MVRLLLVALLFTTSNYASETETRLRKSLPVASATRLTLAADFGFVTVQPGTGRNVDVEVYFRGVPPSHRELDRMLHDFVLDITRQGEDVRVNAAFHGGWKPMSFATIFGDMICRNWRCLEYSSWLRKVEYRVTVPQPFNIDVSSYGSTILLNDLRGEVNAHTSGGSLNFDHIEGPITGHTSGGAITLRGAKGRTVVHTSGGSIRISDVAGDVDASTSGGSISIDRVFGRIEAHTSGGQINAREVTGSIDASTFGGTVTVLLLGQPAEECRLSTYGGSIIVRLARDVRVDLDASTTGGYVSTDFTASGIGDRHPHELRVPLNGGGPLFYLHTSGGEISVRSAT